MKIGIPRAKLKLYAWIGAAMVLIGSLMDTAANGDSFWVNVRFEIWKTAYILSAHMFFLEFVWPRLNRREIFTALGLLLCQFLIYSFLYYGWRHLGQAMGLYNHLTKYDGFLEGVCDQFQQNLGSLFFVGVIRHIYNYVTLKNMAQQLRIEKQEAELNYLKSQTNPHFLFNTLNNIYALAKDKSDLAPDSIVRLSEILRFMLYETKGDYIAIGQEIKIIQDYIDLEKLRYDASLRVDFHCEVPDLQQPIPPLLLIALVENAFKHGASETRERPFVEIRLQSREQRLSFLVQNSTEPPEAEEQAPIRENIGLSNLRRQLELLYKDFRLELRHQGSVFTAQLHINLASHV